MWVFSILILTFCSCGVPSVVTIPVDRTGAFEHTESNATNKLNDSVKKEIERYSKLSNAVLAKDSPFYGLAWSYFQKLNNIQLIRNKINLNDIELYIISVDEIMITSFPPNKILLSSSLFSSDAPCAPDVNVMVGLLAHELCHLSFKHTQVKWSWWYNNDRANTLILENILLNLLSIPLPLNFSITTSEFYKYNLDYCEWYFESVADLFALKCMSVLGFDPLKYYTYFKTVKEKSNDNICAFNQENQVIQDRIERMKYYFSDFSWFKDPQHLLTIVFEKLPSENGLKENCLSSPKMRKMLSDTANKDYSELFRSINYWRCAIKQYRFWNTPFLKLENLPLVDLEGDTSYTVSTITIPLSIYGFSSFVLDGYNLQKLMED